MSRSRGNIEAMQQSFTRRAVLLGGIQGLFILGLGARMRYLQVEKADEFRLLAEENRINIHLIPPARGEVFDRNGAILARNVPSYRIVLVRENTKDVKAVLQRLAQVITLDESDIENAIIETQRSAPFVPVTIAENLSWDDVAAVSVNAPALSGISAQVGLSRAYPPGGEYAHVVGYVGPVSDYDLDRLDDPDPLLRIPRFQIGKVGIEAKRESLLRGQTGTKKVEVSATGRIMRELDRHDSQQGADLQLTIDTKLQHYVQARLGEASASAVVLDVENGDLRAIASSPTFDSNLFVRGISVADYNALIQNKYRPLASKSVQGIYPPGSTFKMVTALAGLEAGIIDPQNTIRCKGHLTVSGRKFHCWKRGGHGLVNLKDSIIESCDVYYYELAQKVGIEKISQVARRLGLGERHDIPMSAVSEGLVPDKDWKYRTHGENWLVGDTVNASIGQGYMLASPLQLAVMTARLATGRGVSPRLIKSVDGIEEPSGAGEHLGFNEIALQQLRSAMYDAVNKRGGTAYGSRIIADTARMAGKTGTSQVRAITITERESGVIKNEELVWEQRDHSLFVNFAPFDAPKYAVCIVVEHGGSGSFAAAPMARDITLQALYGETPPLDAYPAGNRAQILEQQRKLRATPHIQPGPHPGET